MTFVQCFLNKTKALKRKRKKRKGRKRKKEKEDGHKGKSEGIIALSTQKENYSFTEAEQSNENLFSTF